MPERDPVTSLIAIFTAVWALVLVGVIIVFEFIVPLNILGSFFLNSILKAVLAMILGLVWLALFVEMRNFMVKSQLSSRAKSTAS